MGTIKVLSRASLRQGGGKAAGEYLFFRALGAPRRSAWRGAALRNGLLLLARCAARLSKRGGVAPRRHGIVVLGLLAAARCRTSRAPLLERQTRSTWIVARRLGRRIRGGRRRCRRRRRRRRRRAAVGLLRHLGGVPPVRAVRPRTVLQARDARRKRIILESFTSCPAAYSFMGVIYFYCADYIIYYKLLLLSAVMLGVMSMWGRPRGGVEPSRRAEPSRAERSQAEPEQS